VLWHERCPRHAPCPPSSRHCPSILQRVSAPIRILAFVYNALGVAVAAGVLYPALGLLRSPIVAAAAAMGLSSVSVIANALRLKSLKL